MKLKELMNGITPSAEYKGFTTADDMVLAIGFDAEATNDADFIVAQVGITDQAGSLSPKTNSANYLRVGETEIKTGTKRAFSVGGDRHFGDEFQDKILDHKMKYGIGQTVIKPYIYFNMLTGIGEKGMVSIAVENDLGGAPGNNASFSATLTSTTKPTEWTYSAPTQTP